jgi:WD40 repeat protein
MWWRCVTTGTVRLWDPATGTAVGNPLIGHTGEVRAVAAVPDVRTRTLLATASDGLTVRLRDPATGTPLSVLQIGVGVNALCPYLVVNWHSAQPKASSFWSSMRWSAAKR